MSKYSQLDLGSCLSVCDVNGRVFWYGLMCAITFLSEPPADGLLIDELVENTLRSRYTFRCGSMRPSFVDDWQSISCNIHLAVRKQPLVPFQTLLLRNELASSGLMLLVAPSRAAWLL